MKSTIYALLIAALIFAGCEKPTDSPDGSGTSSSGVSTSTLEGTITVEGSSTVEPISLKAKELFNAEHPKVSITIGNQGTGNGFTALAAKEADFSDASRPIKKKEFDSCKAAGVEYIEVPVAYDGLSIVVNKNNDFIKELTIDQLKKIFREDFAAKTWKEVDPSWPDEKLTVYAPGINSGTHDYFVEVIGKKEKLVPIVDPKTNKPVSPTMATIESGEYAPFSRPLFIYVNPEQYSRLEVKKFVDFYLANAKKIVSEASYVPLPDSVYAAAKTHLEKGLTGTHYLDANGEKRPGTIADLYTEANLVK